MNGILVPSGMKRNTWILRVFGRRTRNHSADEVERHRVGGEQRGQDAERQRHGEALHRAGAEEVQHDRRDQLRQVASR